MKPWKQRVQLRRVVADASRRAITTGLSSGSMGFATVLLVGCGAAGADTDLGQEGTEELGSVSQEISNGWTVTGNKTVVSIGNCTAMIYARDTLITAAHCFPALAAGAVATQSVQVRVQSATGGAWSCVVGSAQNNCTASATVRIHPNWDKAGGGWVRDHDVATVRFGQNFPGITSTNTPWMDQGGNFGTLNGYIYGYEGASNLLVSRHQTGTYLRDQFHVRDRTVHLTGANNSGSCPGDSGGPVISDGSLANTPVHHYALVNWGDCNGTTIGPLTEPNANFIIGGIPTGRCQSKNFTVFTSGSLQFVKKLFRCF